MRSVQELEAEIERLRAKLSPLEDKEFTALLNHTLSAWGDATPWSLFEQAQYGGVLHYRADLKPLWEVLFEEEPNIHDITKLGRTLRALGWVQTAKDGKRYYIMPVSEYHEQVR